MLVKMTCPQCGASLEIDDSKEFMFCQFCGTKIANITEKVEVVHSGSVSIDESGKLENFQYVVDNALRSGNYDEAYKYCLRILETDTTDLRANLYKGLSAVMQSTSASIRTSEGITSLQTMCSLGKFAPDNTEVIINFANYVSTMIPVLYDAHCAVKGRQPMNSVKEADNIFNLAYGIVTYITAIITSININLMRTSSNLEPQKLNLINIALKLATRASTPIPYVSGYITKTDRAGRSITEPKIVKARCPYFRELQNCIITIKNENNALPSTAAEINRLDGEIAQRKQVIDSYETALTAFFASHPEQEKTYHHPGLFGREKKRAAIESTFPAELLEQKKLSLQAGNELKEITARKYRFTKEHIM